MSKILNEYYKLTQKPTSGNEVDFTKFTQTFLSILGQHIEETHPELDFSIKCRLKTPKSLLKKADTKEQIFDYIGIRIIINHVPEDFRTGNTEFDTDIAKLLAERSEAIANNTEERARLRSHILENASEVNTKSYQIALDALKKCIDYSDKIIKATDDECSLRVSDFLVKEIAKFECMKVLGITDIPGRLKVHRKDNGYFATHNCVQVSDETSVYNGWKAEIQGKSEFREELAHNGEASHVNRVGKKRILPRLPENINSCRDIKKFQKEVENVVPKYYMYSGKGKVNVYNWYQNFCHYFEATLRDSSAYKKLIDANQQLFDIKY